MRKKNQLNPFMFNALGCIESWSKDDQMEQANRNADQTEKKGSFRIILCYFGAIDFFILIR